VIKDTDGPGATRNRANKNLPKKKVFTKKYNFLFFILTKSIIIYEYGSSCLEDKLGTQH